MRKPVSSVQSINSLPRFLFAILLILALLAVEAPVQTLAAEDLTLISMSMQSGDDGLQVDTNIGIQFSDNIDASTVSADSFRVEGSISEDISGIYSVEDNSILFDPDNDFAYGETIYITLTTDILSLGGASLANEVSLQLTVESDPNDSSGEDESDNSSDDPTDDEEEDNSGDDSSDDPSDDEEEDNSGDDSSNNPSDDEEVDNSGDDSSDNPSDDEEEDTPAEEEEEDSEEELPVTLEFIELESGDDFYFTGHTPDNNDTNIDVDSNIIVNFNTAVFEDTIDLDSFNVDGSLSGRIDGNYSVDGSTVTFNPTADFQPGETITVTLTTGIEDSYENALSAPYTWQFTVEAPSGYANFVSSNSYSDDEEYSYGAVMGDIDGDGDLDIYVSNVGQNSLWINDGSGSFTASATYTDDGDYSSGAVMGDVDGDGDLDIYVFNQGQNSEQNYLLINTSGSFSASNIDGDTGTSEGAVMGDFDGDGDLDIYATKYNAKNKLWINNGSGVFSTSATYTDDGDNSYGAAAGDVDNDGDLDIYVTNYNAQNKLWINNGNATFTESNISGDTGDSLNAAMGDVDGDGDLDIYVTSNAQNKLWINDGSGAFSASATYTDITEFTRGIAMGDVDGDGDLDIYVTNEEQNRLWINDGSGGFSVSNISGDDGYCHGTAMGDIDGDGDLDIYATNYIAQNKLWINTAPPVSISAKTPATNDLDVATDSDITVTFSDDIDDETVTGSTFTVNGSISGNISVQDGVNYSVVDDTVTFTPAADFIPGESVSVTLTTGIKSKSGNSLEAPYTWQFTVETSGGGEFSSDNYTNFSVSNDDTFSVTAGDIDGNCYTDVVFGNYEPGNYVYFFDSDGVDSSSEFNTSTECTYSIALGDIDGDGDLDAAVGNYGEQSYVYFNQGGATPFDGDHTSEFGTGDNTCSVALGDIDGDGDLDIVVASSQNAIYFNQGSGAFSTSTGCYTNLPSTGTSTSVALGDFNNDGWLDIAYGKSADTTPRQNIVYFNQGSGAFSTDSGCYANFGTGSDDTNSIAPGDFDNNGWLDIAVGNDGQNVIYFNDGDGTFDNYSANFGSGADATTSVDAGDLNGNGYLDIASVNYSGSSYIDFNDGDRTFDSGSTSLSTTQPYGVILVDMNSDGALDLVCGNDNRNNTIYYNAIPALELYETDPVSPSQNDIDVAADSDITVKFNQDVDSSTVGSSTFIVNGSISGNISLANAEGYSVNDDTVTFTTDNTDFQYGETVTVTLTTGINSEPGSSMENPYTWQFTVEAPKGDGAFEDSTTIGNADKTEYISVGDINGDGKPDIFVCNYDYSNDSTGQSTIYFNQGGDTPFDSANTLDIGSASDDTLAAALGDVNGDGDLDIVVGNYNQQNYVYLSDGYGNFGPGVTFGTGEDYTSSIALGDMNGDGWLDIVVGNSSNQNYIYFNDGDGTFEDSSTAIGSDSYFTQSIALGDFNGDGELDVAVGNIGQSCVYFNQGSGSFPSDTTTGYYAVGDTGSYTNYIAIGDVDGDNDLDIALGIPGNQAYVYLNDGEGNFDSSITFGSGSDYTYSIALGDLDGDSDLDIAVGTCNEGVAQNVFYLNDGSGAFGSASNLGSPDTTWAIALADINGNGKLDVVVGNCGEINTVYFNYKPLSLYETDPVSPSQNDIDVAADSDITVKFNQDVDSSTIGSSTFIVNGSISGNISLDNAGGYSVSDDTVTFTTDNTDFQYGETVTVTLTTGIKSESGNNLEEAYTWQFTVEAASGDGVFVDNLVFESDSNWSYSAAVGDLNGDSKLDISVANYTTGKTCVYFQQDDGSFSDSDGYYTNFATNDFAIDLGDMDNDGDLDIVTGNDTQKYVYFNDGNGVFPDSDAFGPASGTFTLAVTAGDLDGDGDLDIVAGNMGQNKIYFNQGGDNPFDSEYSANLGGSSGDTSSLKIADLNGDGLLDIACGNSGQSYVYFNQGGGAFSTDSGCYAELGAGSTGGVIDLGDLNNDGYPDIAAAYSSAASVVYFNDGDGTFDTNSTTFGDNDDGTLSVALGDLNGDGYLDIAAGNTAGDSYVYLNDGNGNFSDGSSQFSLGYPYNIAVGDLDSDGDLDLIGVNFGYPNLIYFNMAPLSVSEPTSPARNALDVAADSAISVVFSDNIDSTTITKSTFHVTGSISGNISGKTGVDYTTVNNTVTFTPNADFKYGETITVTLTTAIKSTGEHEMINPYTWQFTVEAPSGDGVFSADNSFSFGESVENYAVAAGDIDGDGDLDIVVGNLGGEGGYQNYIYFNQGGDTPFNSTDIASFGTGDDSTVDIALGDIDGDGDLDITIANAAESSAVYFNKDNGTVWTDKVDIFSNAWSVALGDINADGDLDIVIGTNGSQNTVYFNQGSGTFSSDSGCYANFGDGEDNTRDIALGDLNNDGLLDIAVGNYYQQNVVYFNQGSGTFSNSDGCYANFGTSTSCTSSVAIGDLNADGNLDITAGNYGDGSTGEWNVVYFNDGDGSFDTSSANIGPAADATYSIAIGDLNGDHNLDFFTANFNGEGDTYSYVCFNDDSAFDTDYSSLNTGKVYSTSMADINGDGSLDLICGTHYGSQSIVYFNTTVITVSSTSPATNDIDVDVNSTISVVFSDNIDSTTVTNATFHVNGSLSGNISGKTGVDYTTVNDTVTFTPAADFMPGETVTVTLTKGIESTDEFVLENPYTWQFTAAAPEGTGAFTAADLPTDTDASQSSAMGDVDGDGDLDIYVGNNGGNNILLLNDGEGTFTTSTGYSDGTATDSRCVVMGDVDNDGDLDIYVANYNNGQNQLWINNGDGTFTESNITGDTESSTGTVIGDVDGDGDLDIYVANYGAKNKLWLNDGEGTFTASTGYSEVTATSSMSAVMGDIDNDGDLDIYVANYSNSTTNELWLNNGSGNFTASDDYSGQTISSYGASMGDINGDGYLDIFDANNGTNDYLWTNDGDGTFTRSNIGASTTSRYAAIGDIDSDGDLDIFVVKPDSSRANELLVNNGVGGFSSTSLGSSDIGASYAAAMGDVNGDGALDIFVAVSGAQNRLWLNTTPFKVSELSPEANDLDVAAGSDITVTFSHDVLSTLDLTNSFNVDGSISGRISGSFNIDGKTITFDPTSDFEPGETVTVTLTTGIKDSLDEALTSSCTWQFTVEASGTGIFSSDNSFSFGDSVENYAVAAGDIDGDGDLDIIVGNLGGEGGYQNYIYFNQGGDAPFNSTDIASFGTGDDSTVDIALGDIDGDGDLDIAIANAAESSAVYFNKDNGTVWTDSVNIFSNAYSVALGDINADGDLDIVIGTNGSQNTVYFNQGSGTFSSDSGCYANFGTSEDNTRDIALADLNNDGLLDIIVGNYNQQNVVYFNQGNGTFSNSDGCYANFGTSTSYTISVAIGDLNADGNLDIAAGNYGDSSTGEWNIVYFNDGEGAFDNSSANIGPEADPTYSIAIGDLNGDHNLDFFTANFNGEGDTYSYVCFNDDSAFDTDYSSLNTGKVYSTSMADINGDGSLDLICGTHYGSQSIVYFNTPAVTVSSSSPAANDTDVSVDANITATFSKDIDDSTADDSTFIVTGSVSGNIAGSVSVDGSTVTFNPTDNFRNGETVTVTLTTGIESTEDHTMANSYTWQFTAKTSGGGQLYDTLDFGTGSDFTVFLDIADLNYDGYLDIVGTGPDVDSYVYFNHGNNTFAASDISTFSDENAATLFVVADMNGDGYQDLVTNNGDIFFNNGSGGFTSSGSFPILKSEDAYGISVGDIDGDGDIDIIVVYKEDLEYICFNDGDGTFDDTTPVSFGSASDDQLVVVPADIDSDGDLDIVVGNKDSCHVVYFNNGYGTDWSESITFGHNSGYSTYCLALGDVDDDGDLDIAVADSTGNHKSEVYVYDNNDNSFNSVIEIGSSAYTTYGIALADIDGDGHLDIVTTNYTDCNYVYFNDGDGTFDTDSQSFGAEKDASTDLAVVDFEGDGDMDIAVGGVYTQNKLYLNGTSEITVTQSSTVFSDGNTYAFGSVTTGKTSSVTFTIKNDGDADLTLTTPVAFADNTDHFSITTQPDATITAGNSTSLVIQFAPTAAGDYSTSISIACNDSDENPFDINLTGTGKNATSGGSSGGSGSSSSSDYKFFDIDNLGAETQLAVDSDGKVVTNAEITSPDGTVTIDVPKGTVIKDSNGSVISQNITVTELEDAPAPPKDKNIIGLAYDFEPDGYTFDPYLVITFYYDEDDLPEGVIEDELQLAYYDENTGEWVTITCTVDTENNCIKGYIEHFTTFAVLYSYADRIDVPDQPETTPQPTSTPAATSTPESTPASTPAVTTPAEETTETVETSSSIIVYWVILAVVVVIIIVLVILLWRRKKNKKQKRA